MLFFKKGSVKSIPDNACWGHLVNHHKVDVDTLRNVLRCVQKEGEVKGVRVSYLRIFDRREAGRQGVEIKDWETLDGHPELVAFEGYINVLANTAFLERKNF